MALVHDLIAESLKAGHSMDSIIADLSKSEDDEEKTFAKNWLETANNPKYQPGEGKGPGLVGTITPMLDVVNEYPKTTLGVLGGVAAATVGTKAYNAYQDRKMKREAHESELEKNRAYARQVELSAQKAAGPTTEDIIAQTKQMNQAPVPEVSKVNELQARAQALREATQPVAPTAPTPAVQGAAPAPVQAQVGAVPAQPVTSSVAETVATGGDVGQSVKEVVAKELDAATGVKPRIRQSKEQLAQAIANAPEGKIPAYPVKNKKAGDIIGQGGWHWYQGQMGPEAEQEWLRQFGRTNQPYQEVVNATKSGQLAVPAPVEGKKGGTFPREQYVPEYIKGHASPAAMLSMLGNALGLAGIAHEVKQAKKTGDWSNVGMDVIGQILGNVAPKAGLGFSLMTPSTLNANEAEELARYRQKAPTGAVVPR